MTDGLALGAALHFDHELASDPEPFAALARALFGDRSDGELTQFVEVIRGPQWGTFLGAEHVKTLGGIARIERESGCARVVPLGSGGAFLQATPIDQPIVEDTDDGGVLARLSAFLAPVMGTRSPAMS